MQPFGIARTIGLVVVSLLAAACSKQTPAAPTQSAPAAPPHPSISVASVVVQAAARFGGHEYSATIQLKETAGVAATISGVDLVFSSGATTLASSHFDRPISETANLCAPNGTVETRVLLTTDPEASHAYATTVQVRIAFTDSSGFAGAATASVDVPAVPATAQTVSLTGLITDITTHAGLAGARLEVLNGQNAGKVTVADSTGSYLFPELTAETFRLRASANDHDSGEQNVTVPANPRADFELRPIVMASPRPGCPATLTYDETPDAHAFLAHLPVGCLGTSATDVTWLRFTASHGGGTFLDLAVDANPGSARTGHLTFSDGGVVFTTFIVNQAAGDCVTAISPTSQTFGEGGGSGTVAVTARAGCTWQASINTANLINATITSGAQGTGSAMVSFAVAANPDVFQHAGFVTIGVFTDQLTQAACPVTVSPLTLHAPKNGGPLMVGVSAARNFCTWSDYSNSPFIERSFEQHGGTATVTFYVDANTTGQSRSGSLYVAGQTVVVTQDGI